MDDRAHLRISLAGVGMEKEVYFVLHGSLSLVLGKHDGAYLAVGLCYNSGITTGDMIYANQDSDQRLVKVSALILSWLEVEKNRDQRSNTPVDAGDFLPSKVCYQLFTLTFCDANSGCVPI